MARESRSKGRSVAFIDPDSCTGCGACLEFRPTDPKNRPEMLGCITLEEGTYAQLNGLCVIEQDACVGCTLCVQYCPWAAIEMVYSDGSIQPTVQATGYLKA